MNKAYIRYLKTTFIVVILTTAGWFLPTVYHDLKLASKLKKLNPT